MPVGHSCSVLWVVLSGTTNTGLASQALQSSHIQGETYDKSLYPVKSLRSR